MVVYLLRLMNIFCLLLPLSLQAQHTDTLIFMDETLDEDIYGVNDAREEKVVIKELPAFYGARGISYDRKKHVSTLWDLKNNKQLAVSPHKVYAFAIPRIAPYEDLRLDPPGNKILYKASSNKKVRIEFLDKSLIPHYFEVQDDDEKVRYLDSNLTLITSEWSAPTRFWPGGAYYFPVKNHRGVFLYNYSGIRLNKRPYSSHAYVADHLAGYEHMQDQGGVYAVISKKKRYGLMAPTGSILVKIRYDSILAGNANTSMYALLFKNGKGRLFNTKAGVLSKPIYEFGAFSQQLDQFRWNEDDRMNIPMLIYDSIVGILRRQGAFFTLHYDGSLAPLTELPEDTPKEFREYIGWRWQTHVKVRKQQSNPPIHS